VGHALPRVLGSCLGQWRRRESNPFTRYATPVLYHLSYNPIKKCWTDPVILSQGGCIYPLTPALASCTGLEPAPTTVTR
jgi:hypothetical protein